MPRVIKTSASVKAILRELFQWATCVAPSARVKAARRLRSEAAKQFFFFPSLLGESEPVRQERGSISTLIDPELNSG